MWSHDLTSHDNCRINILISHIEMHLFFKEKKIKLASNVTFKEDFQLF